MKHKTDETNYMLDNRNPGPAVLCGCAVFLQYAQAGDQNYLSMHICTEEGSETVDSAYLTVSYRLTRKRFDHSEKWTTIRCQYGDHIVLQTDMWLLYSKQQFNGFNENLAKEKQTEVEEKWRCPGMDRVISSWNDL